MSNSAETVLVPPDGGWGWMIVLGVAIVQLNARSMEQCFGLVFGDMLDDLGVRTTGATVITSTMDILINFSGILTGPLIRKFSYRKVTAVGALYVGIGLILTTFATNVSHIIITYSIINGLGAGLTTSSTFVALNRYFVKKRGRAFGYSVAGSALGMVLIPQAAQILLHHYGFRGAILIMGGFSLHALVGACLLQPAEWHYVPLEQESQKKPMETIAEEEGDDEEAQTRILLNTDLGRVPKNASENTFKDFDTFQTKFRKSASTKSFEGSRIKNSGSDQDMSAYGQMDLTGSTTFLNFESADDLKVVKKPRKRHHSVAAMDASVKPERTIKDVVLSPEFQKLKEKKKTSIWQKVHSFMDFDILHDPVYVNLVIGLSLFYSSEGNFKTVIPFFFRNLGYDTKGVALFLSVQSFTDICARLILPSVLDRFNFTKRQLFWVGLLLLALSRGVMALQTEFIPMIIVLAVAGIIRGFVFINFLITISEVVPIEKFPAAMGLHMVIRGFFVIFLGPPLGYIRDATGSYKICIFSQCVLLIIAFIAWSIEFFLRSKKAKATAALEDS
ncbi:monocarboxylate transporter 9-like [Agrilus planipennis]|uniref:Monocarboxylate transporter 9-like n=1 Tax=Agrilus planipennis TaxID=224129 RepID=A0A7F5R5Y8_AGRPL|nr:monocarboxylate transporter 9-like [Agrilus planipennis]